MKRPAALLTLLVVLVMGTGADFAKKSLGGGFVPPPPSSPGTVIDIFPGQDWDSTVAAHPGSTWFRIKAGRHDQNEAFPNALLDSPKDGSVFWGEDGAVLSGLDTLNNFGNSWFPVENRVGTRTLYYTVTGIGAFDWAAIEDTLGGQTCQGAATDSACRFKTNVVFTGGKRLLAKRVNHIDSLDIDPELDATPTSGRAIYYDLVNDTLWSNVWGNTQLVEVTAHNGTAIRNNDDADYVALINLTIEGYTGNAHGGAAVSVGNGQDWLIQDCTFRFNHHNGLSAPQSADGEDNSSFLLVERSKFYQNGCKGMDGRGQYLFRNNEVYENNRQQFGWGWGSGGVKTIFGRGNVIEGNWFHDNEGQGYWTDGESTAVIRNNLCERNWGNGLEIELLVGGTIYSNVCRNNGTEFPGAGIHIACGRNISVIGNVITVPDTSTTIYKKPGGIILAAGRVDSTHEKSVDSITVKHNTITWGDEYVRHGIRCEGAVDCSGPRWETLVNDRNIVWDFNTHVVGSIPTPFGMSYPETNGEFADWQAQGFDLSGVHDSS